MKIELGLIGATLRHSFSRKYFLEKFRREGIDGDYSLFELPRISLLPELIAQHPGLRGLNVTIPYKESVIPFLSSLSSLSDKAARIGAVNTILISHEESGPILKGYNTDADGFRLSLLPLLDMMRNTYGKGDYTRGIILGTGGAAKAVGAALMEEGIDPLFVSRHPDKAPFPEKTVAYSDLSPALVNACRIIVNATPLGTFPDCREAPPFPYHLLTPRHICHDLVYNPEVTTFMRLSQAQGAAVKNGMEMLRNQAELAWNIWK